MQLAIENRMNLHRHLFWFAQIAVAGLVILLTAHHHFIQVNLQPESTNIVGYFDFKFKSKDLQNLSQPWRYTWHNSGTIASVEQMCKHVSGKGKLIVFDGAGNQVYSRALGEDGSFFTKPGVAGEWTIQVVFENEAY